MTFELLITSGSGRKKVVPSSADETAQNLPAAPCSEPPIGVVDKYLGLNTFKMFCSNTLAAILTASFAVYFLGDYPLFTLAATAREALQSRRREFALNSRTKSQPPMTMVQLPAAAFSNQRFTLDLIADSLPAAVYQVLTVVARNCAPLPFRSYLIPQKIRPTL